MKNLITNFIACTIFFFFFSCTDSKEQIEDQNMQFLEQVANDPVFIEYQKIRNKLAIGVAANQFEIAAINTELDKYPEQYICNISTSLVSQFKGGAEYLQLHCDLDKAAIALHEKYPNISKIKAEERLRILEISAENGLLPSVQQMAAILKSERKKSQQ
jgi:hypothetical protein